MNILLLNIFFFINSGILLGFLFPNIMKKLCDVLIEISFYFFIPLFIFTNLSTTKLSPSLIFPISSVSWIVVGSGIFFSYISSKIIKIPLREIVLPITFMNSAYLNFPLQNFILGEKALTIAVIYNLNITLLHFTVGVYLVRRKTDKFYKIIFPFFAGVLGILLNIFSLKIPAFFLVIEDFLKNYFIPSMLILVGWQLSLIKVKKLFEGLFGSFLRMFGGFIVSFIILNLFNIEPYLKNSILLSSSLPSAVNTFVLSKKFNSNPDFASSSIFVGTIIAIVLYPLIFPVF